MGKYIFVPGSLRWCCGECGVSWEVGKKLVEQWYWGLTDDCTPDFAEDFSKSKPSYFRRCRRAHPTWLIVHTKGDEKPDVCMAEHRGHHCRLPKGHKGKHHGTRSGQTYRTMFHITHRHWG